MLFITEEGISLHGPTLNGNLLLSKPKNAVKANPELEARSPY